MSVIKKYYLLLVSHHTGRPVSLTNKTYRFDNFYEQSVYVTICTLTSVTVINSLDY